MMGKLSEHIADLCNKYTIMQTLESDHVFTVEEEDGQVYARECCDDYFAVDLTKADVENIAKFFTALAEAM